MSLFHHIHCSASLAAVTVFLGTQGLIIRDTVLGVNLPGGIQMEATSVCPPAHPLPPLVAGGDPVLLTRPMGTKLQIKGGSQHLLSSLQPAQ